MPTFDVAINPYDVTARAPHLKNNNIMGWIPGEIVEIADSGKIGRIRVSSAILQPNESTPNGWDGYALVLEDFVNNNAKGGSHKFLQRGAQVAMLPMMGGDLTQLLVIGCIPSLTDQPSPELDRDKGLYGQHTPGQVFKINNDKEASSIDARPTGAVQHVSKEGDISAQTKNGARYALQSDGTVQLQNDLASTVLSPDGTVETKNKQQGSFTLKDDGSLELKSSSEAALNLIEGKAELSGPLHPVSNTIKELGQKLPVAMSNIRDTLGQITAAMDDFKSGGDLGSLIGKIQPLLSNFNDIKSTLEGVAGSIDQLAKVDVKDLTGLLMPQVEKFLGSNVSQMIPKVTEIVEKLTSGESIVDELIKILPAELSKTLDKTTAAPILDALQNNKPMQTQFLLDAITPGGLSSIQGIAGLDLHPVLDEIYTGFKDVPLKPTPTDVGETGKLPTNPLELEFALNQWQKQAEKQQTKLTSLLPEGVRKYVSDEDLTKLIQSVSTGGSPMEAIESILGKVSTGAIAGLVPQVQDVLKITDAAPLINDLITTIGKGGDLSSLVPSLLKSIPGMPPLDTNDLLGSAINTALPLAMDYLTGGMGGSIGSLMGGANGISSLFGKKNKGGTIQLTEKMVEVKASQNGAGASLKVTEPQAALVGTGGLTQVFAGTASAGISSPWGTFGLGAGGADFISQAKMAFQVAQGIGKSAGFTLDPKSGASLASKELDKKTAEITVDDGHVILNSHKDPSSVPGIDIAPNGVFIEGLRVPEIWNYVRSLNKRFLPYESAIQVKEEGTSIDDIVVQKLDQRLVAAEATLKQLDERLTTAGTTLEEVSGWYKDWLATAEIVEIPLPSPPPEV